ncbi:hypothetical protein HQ403_01945 [Candidatus Kaiserbacteria bacterium]|nr:hypothetical protein [Candidatus Kaiserbacteria bacterium]
MSPEKQKKAAIDVLKKVLVSEHSGFYREKYSAHIDTVDAIIKGSEEWEALPFLTRDDIQNSLYSDRLYIPFNDVRLVRATSGTSGLGILTIPRVRLHPAPLFDKQYLQPDSIKRAVTFSGAHCVYADNFRKRFNLDSIYLDPGDVNISSRLFSIYKPDILFGFPYAVASLLPHINDKELLKSVKVVSLFGEWCSELQWKNFEKHFPNALIISEYASVESQSTLCGPCSEIIKNKERFVHPFPDSVYAELIDPATNSVITEEGVSGELVVTVLRNPAFPLIRYKTGDSARIIRSSCSCGIGTSV